MKSLRITDDPAFTLPIDAVTETFAFLAKRGKGKSYAAGVLVEELSEAGAQVVVIDPTDAWWGLKSSADGKAAGYPFIIFGGNHSDIPLVQESGKLLAEFVIESGRSVIICTRLLSKSASVRLVGDFFERLYEVKGQAGKGSPLFCMLDECDLFIPQMVRPDMAKCVGAIDDVVRRGRNVGLGVGLISQRAAKINKDVLSQVEVLVALQTSGPHDRKALQTWIEANADADEMGDFWENIASLPRGTAYIWSPSWLQILKRISFRNKRTFDSGKTPKAGETVIAPRRLAEIDLAAVRSKMASVVEKIKSDDPAELRKEITRLKNELHKRPTEKAPTPEPVVKHVLKDSQITALGKTVERLEALQKKNEDLAEDVARNIAEIRGAINLTTRSNNNHRPKTPPVTMPAVRHPVTPVRRVVEMPGLASPLGKCERALLSVLAAHPEGCRLRKLILLSGYSFSGSTRNSLGKLRSIGAIVGGNSDAMKITDVGVNLGPFDELPTGRELIDYWLNFPHFGKCERSLLQALVDNPDGLTLEPLLQAANYDFSGSTRNALGALRTAEVIVGRNSETIRLCDELLEQLAQ